MLCSLADGVEAVNLSQPSGAVRVLFEPWCRDEHDPFAYLKDVLGRLPSHPAGRIE